MSLPGLAQVADGVVVAMPGLLPPPPSELSRPLPPPTPAGPGPAGVGGPGPILGCRGCIGDRLLVLIPIKPSGVPGLWTTDGSLSSRDSSDMLSCWS
jgi:hypothetical protein